MQMLLMAMHTDGADQSHHMEHGIIVFDMLEKFMEGGNFFIILCCNGFADADQVRFYGPTRAYGHVTHLTVAYHSRKQANMFAARLQERMGKIVPQVVEKRSAGRGNSIILLLLPVTPAVQNYQGNALFHLT